MAVCASSLGYAQVNVSVDHGRWASVPLEKKYGVNIPFDISMDDLEKNISAIEDLQLRVVRVHNGWGMEGEGKLVEASPITLNGDKLEYDFTAMDKLLELIQATGAKPTLVNGYGPQVLTGQFNTMPEDKLDLWGELNKLVADHIESLAMPVEIEVWDNASDQEYFTGDQAAYTALLGPAFKNLQGHNYIKVGYGGIASAYVISRLLEEQRKSETPALPKVQEVSQRCGYTDQHYFSYCFKKYCGESPNAMRRRLEQERAGERP